MPSETKPFHAILWMVVTGFLSVCIYAMANLLGKNYGFPPIQIVLFYNLAGLVFYVPVMLWRRLDPRTARAPLYATRGVLEFLGFTLSIWGLSQMPLPMHTALTFTSPLFGSIAAVWLLKEQGSFHRWISLLIGFVGVLMVSRPGVTEFGLPAIAVLGGSLCFAFCGVCIKKLTHTEPTPRIAFYMMAMTAIVALPFALLEWQPVTVAAIPLLLVLGLLVALVQITVGLAYARGDMTLILPFNFLNLVWSAIIALFLFNQLVSVWTLAGGAVIIAAAVYGIRHASRANMATTVRVTAGGS